MTPAARQSTCPPAPRTTRKAKIGADRASTIARFVARWFLSHQRPLPWREADPVRGAGFRDPYKSLVSEFMLQQTQVSRVLEKFGPFLARFPTVHALAAAHEDEVLAAWTGLGYYRRAKLLHAAARAIADRHKGHVPHTLGELENLPGIGRYTAGAVASMAHGLEAALVDTNVSRVLLRVEGKDIAGPRAVAWSWDQASRLAAAAHALPGITAGIVNEGLMELGALICKGKAPACGACPLAGGVCIAEQRGVQGRIPRSGPRAERTPATFAVVVVTNRRGELLLEQRPGTGLWAGLWQPPTRELGPDDTVPTTRSLSTLLRLAGTLSFRQTEEFTFNTTHRAVRFVVWECDGSSHRRARGRRWVPHGHLDQLGLSSPVRRILKA